MTSQDARRAVADDHRPGRPTPPSSDRAGIRPAPLLRELLGEQLRAERRRQGRTLAEVAGRAGMSMQHLSDVERGRKDPSSELLAAVLGALGVDLPLLLLRVADGALEVPGDETAGSGSASGPAPMRAGRPQILDLTGSDLAETDSSTRIPGPTLPDGAGGAPHSSVRLLAAA